MKTSIYSSDVYMGTVLKNKDLTLTVYKTVERDVASAIEVNGKVVKTSASYPYNYKQKLKDGVYSIKLLYSDNYSENDGVVTLLDPINEASTITITVE